MSYKIAVASSDGKVVNQHFGRATQFLVFQVEKDTYKFLELLQVAPFCQSGEHEEQRLLTATDVLIGCRAVVVSQIGKGSEERLTSLGIESFAVKDLIEEALKGIIQYFLAIDESEK